MSSTIAVIGNNDVSMMFKMIGCQSFSPDGEDETRKILNKLIVEYKIILIDENYALFVSDIIVSLQDKPFPLILVIPSSCKENNYSLNKIDEVVERALGVKLNLEKNSKRS